MPVKHVQMQFDSLELQIVVAKRQREMHLIGPSKEKQMFPWSNQRGASTPTNAGDFFGNICPSTANNIRQLNYLSPFQL